MPRFYVEIAHKGKVVHSCQVSAATDGEAIDLGWDQFDPEGRVDFLDTSHNAWVTEIRASGDHAAYKPAG